MEFQMAENKRTSKEKNISGGYTSEQIRTNIDSKLFVTGKPANKHYVSECWEDFRQIFRKDGSVVENWFVFFIHNRKLRL